MFDPMDSNSKNIIKNLTYLDLKKSLKNLLIIIMITSKNNIKIMNPINV